MAVVTVLGRGTNLDDLPLWGPLDSLPYSLDSSVWKSAVYYEISDIANIAADGELMPEIEIKQNILNIPCNGNFKGGLEGHGWITKNEEGSSYIWTVESR